MERDSARGGIQPGLKILSRFAQTELGFSAWANGPENLKNSHVIETEFQLRAWTCAVILFISARAEVCHVIATKFQPGLKFRHVIRPSVPHTLNERLE